MGTALRSSSTSSNSSIKLTSKISVRLWMIVPTISLDRIPSFQSTILKLWLDSLSLIITNPLKKTSLRSWATDRVHWEGMLRKNLLTRDMTVWGAWDRRIEWIPIICSRRRTWRACLLCRTWWTRWGRLAPIKSTWRSSERGWLRMDSIDLNSSSE